MPEVVTKIGPFSVRQSSWFTSAWRELVEETGFRGPVYAMIDGKHYWSDGALVEEMPVNPPDDFFEKARAAKVDRLTGYLDRAKDSDLVRLPLECSASGRECAFDNGKGATLLLDIKYVRYIVERGYTLYCRADGDPLAPLSIFDATNEFRGMVLPLLPHSARLQGAAYRLP